MSDTYNLNILQGNSVSYQLIAKDSNGVPLNLSGLYSRGYIKYQYSNTGHLLNLNPQIYTGNYSSGIININLSGTQTKDIPVGQYPYDVEIYNSDESYVNKFLRGYANFSPETST